MGLDNEKTSADELVARVEQLERVQPVSALQGHDVCADIHTALDVVHTLIISRDSRGFVSPASESTVSLLRELRAMGVNRATPELVAMIAIVDTAVDQLADASVGRREFAWEQLRKDVLGRHCSAPCSEG